MQDRKQEISATPQCLFNKSDAKPFNVIFLDIDGVLLKNSDGYRNRKAFEENLSFIRSKLGDEYKNFDLYDLGATLRFSSDAVNNLKLLCQKTNAKIVISSNWRIDVEERREESLAKLRGLFKLWDLDSSIIDQTPHHGERAKEIKTWLDSMGKKVNSFVILDDIDSGLSASFRKNFIYTGDSNLFTERHLKNALSIFGKKIHALSP